MININSSDELRLLIILIETEAIKLSSVIMAVDILINNQDNIDDWLCECSTVKNKNEFKRLLMDRIEYLGGETLSRNDIDCYSIACYYHCFQNKTISFYDFALMSGEYLECSGEKLNCSIMYKYCRHIEYDAGICLARDIIKELNLQKAIDDVDIYLRRFEKSA